MMHSNLNKGTRNSTVAAGNRIRKWRTPVLKSVQNGPKLPFFGQFGCRGCPIFGPEKADYPGFLGIWEGQNGPDGLKTGQKHLFEHPKWSRNIFGKIDFGPFSDPQVTPVTLP